MDSLRVWCTPPLRPSALEIEQQLSRSFRTPPILITLMRRLPRLRLSVQTPFPNCFSFITAAKEVRDFS